MLAYQVWLLSRMDPLKSLFEKPALSGRTARWQLLLSEFDITYVTQKSIKARAPPAYLKLRPLSSNQCLPWPVLPCSYLHRKRTALFNPAFCHSLSKGPARDVTTYLGLRMNSGVEARRLEIQPNLS